MENSFYKRLKKNAEIYADKTAVLYDTFNADYKTLFQDTVKKAIHLSRFPGKRIAIYGPASYRWIVNVFGIIMAGKDVILVDFFLPQDERNDLLKKIGVDYTLSSTNQYILADEAGIIIPHADHDDIEGMSYNKDIIEGNILMYTATANETDKAVVLTTSNLLNTVDVISGRCMCDENDKVLSQISLHHIFGFVYSLLLPLNNGACVCIGRGLRHIDSDTYYYEPTILSGSPSMIEYLKKVKAFNSELKKVIIGGASCSFRLFEYLRGRDLKVYNIYGMTECSGCIAINNTMDGLYEIFDETEVSLGTDGQILVKGSCVMAGYDKDEETNRNVLSDGVYNTGDYGRITNEGKLVLVRRNPDILLLPTGEKISRKIINDEITALNGVAESCLTLYNDKLTAVIVPLEKGMPEERIKKRIDAYNAKKGYRWEIENVIVRNKAFSKKEDGTIDEKKLEMELKEE